VFAVHVEHETSVGGERSSNSRRGVSWAEFQHRHSKKIKEKKKKDINIFIKAMSKKHLLN